MRLQDQNPPLSCKEKSFMTFNICVTNIKKKLNNWETQSSKAHFVL